MSMKMVCFTLQWQDPDETEGSACASIREEFIDGDKVLWEAMPKDYRNEVESVIHSEAHANTIWFYDVPSFEIVDSTVMPD